MVVHKFELPDRPGARNFESKMMVIPLRFDVQNDMPVFWAVVNDQTDKVRYRVTTVLTGAAFSMQGIDHLYAGTTMHKGWYMLHHFISVIK